MILCLLIMHHFLEIGNQVSLAFWYPSAEMILGARQFVHTTFRTHDISYKTETRHFVQK